MRIKLIAIILIIFLSFNIASCASNNNQNNLDTSLSNNESNFWIYWALSMTSIFVNGIIFSITKQGGEAFIIIGTGIFVLTIPAYVIYFIASRITWN